MYDDYNENGRADNGAGGYGTQGNDPSGGSLGQGGVYSGSQGSQYYYQQQDTSYNGQANGPSSSQATLPYGTWYRDMNQDQEPGNGKKRKKKKEKGSKGGGLRVFKKALVAILVGVLFGVSAGVSLYAVYSITGMKDGLSAKEEAREPVKLQESVGEQPADGDAAQASSGSASQAQVSVTEVVKNVMPAMVSITNTSIQTGYFFGQPISQESTGAGSGIIIGQNDTELLVVSNYHVITDASELTVQFINGTTADAKVKGQNASMDLAVVAVALDDLDQETLSSIKIATMGNSDALQIGESVIAIGNALGYGQSVSVGVVSALDRQIQVSDGSNIGSSNKLIQTDAAINPGNSGGALLNTKGEVIGINSNKIGGESVEGMGYAIPISSVRETIESMMNTETREVVDEKNRGYLGVNGLNVTSDVSEMYNIPMGFYVDTVQEGSAAEAAGLVRGDIIVEVEGTPVTCYDELQDALSYYAIGDTIHIKVMQGSPNGYQPKEVEVTLQGRDDTQ